MSKLWIKNVNLSLITDTSEGIYRLSGNASTILRIKTEANKGTAIFISGNYSELLDPDTDINAVSGILKLFFRELLDSLIPFSFFDRFIAAIGFVHLNLALEDYNVRLIEIKILVQALPKENYTVLEFLFRHLSHISSGSDINKMESSNLAIVFAYFSL